MEAESNNKLWELRSGTCTSVELDDERIINNGGKDIIRAWSCPHFSNLTIWDMIGKSIDVVLNITPTGKSCSHARKPVCTQTVL